MNIEMRRWSIEHYRRRFVMAAGSGHLLTLEIAFNMTQARRLTERCTSSSFDSTEFEALRVAAAYGQVATTELLLKRGVNVEITNSKIQMQYANSPLILAVISESDRTTQMLLDYDADVNASTNGQTALHAAIRIISSKKSLSIVTLLLQYGADINNSMSVRESVLYCAAAWGSSEVVKLLLDKGAEIERGDDYCSTTPLMIASEKGRVATVRLLLEYGADIHALNDELRTPLEVTANGPVSFSKDGIFLEGRLEIARLLLRHGAHVNDSRTPQPALFAAIYSSSTDMVSLMLNAGATVWNHNHEAALRYACVANPKMKLKRRLEIMRLLLANDADINDNFGWYGLALTSIALDRNFGLKHKLIIIRFLLEHDAAVDQGDASALLKTCKASLPFREKLEIIRLMIVYECHRSERSRSREKAIKSVISDIQLTKAQKIVMILTLLQYQQASSRDSLDPVLHYELGKILESAEEGLDAIVAKVMGLCVQVGTSL